MTPEIANLIAGVAFVGLSLVWLGVVLLRWREHRRRMRVHTMRYATVGAWP